MLMLMMMMMMMMMTMMMLMLRMMMMMMMVMMVRMVMLRMVRIFDDAITLVPSSSAPHTHTHPEGHANNRKSKSLVCYQGESDGHLHHVQIAARYCLISNGSRQSA